MKFRATRLQQALEQKPHLSEFAYLIDTLQRRHVGA